MGPETSKVFNRMLAESSQNTEESGEMGDVQDSQDSTSDPLADQVKCRMPLNPHHGHPANSRNLHRSFP